MAFSNQPARQSNPEQHPRTLRDDKELHARYRDWSDDDLGQVRLVPHGTRLDQGATYMDLAENTPREFTATADMQAGQHQCCVEKSGVPFELWNRLLGIESLERTNVTPSE